MNNKVYKYGIDITNATLQTYAYELGLSKAVSEMSQSEKMQLRLIAILDQSEVAWTDLSRTINSPSNMLRQFQANMSNLGRTIGSFFIPILQKVLPIVNGLAIALQRLMVWFANLIGVQIDLSGFGEGSSDATSGMEDYAGAVEEATKATDKLNRSTRKWDELNNITSKQDSGASGGGSVGGGIDLTNEIGAALEEYQKKWNEAFENMENKAETFANKIEAYFKPGKKTVENLVDAFKNLVEPLSKINSTINSGFWDGFWTVIDLGANGIAFIIEGIASALNFLISVIPEPILTSIGGALGVLVGTLTVFLGLYGIISIIGGIGEKLGLLFAGIAAHPYLLIASGLVTLVGALYKFHTIAEDPFSRVSEDVLNMIEDLDNALGKLEDVNQGLEDALETADTKYVDVSAIGNKYFDLSQKEELTESDLILLQKYKDELEGYVGDITGYVDEITGAWTGTREEMEKLIDKNYEYYKQQAYADYLVEAYKAQANVEIEIGKIEVNKKNVEDEINAFYKEVESIVGRELSKTNPVFDIESLIMSGDLDSSFLKQAKHIEQLKIDLNGYNVALQDANDTLAVHQQEVETIESLYNDYSSSTDDNSVSMDKNTESIEKNTTAIKDNANASSQSQTTITTANKEVEKSYENTKIRSKEHLNNLTSRLKVWAQDSKTIGAEAGNNTSTSYIDNIKDLESDTNPILEGLSNLFTSMGSSIGASTGKNIADAMGTEIDNNKSTLASKLASIFDGVGGAFSMLASWTGINIGGYAMGGFPTQGDLFFANEAGPELIGTIGGKTAVAPNGEITGIKDAIYSSMAQEMELMREQNQLLRGILNKEFGITENDIGKAARNYSISYKNRTGRPAYT